MVIIRAAPDKGIVQKLVMSLHLVRLCFHTSPLVDAQPVQGRLKL